MKTFFKKHFWVFAVVIAGLFLTFCLVLSGRQQLWFDESYSIMVAENDIPTIIDLASADIHPPLFYLLLHFWGSFFGFSEWALRFFIILISSITVAIAIIFTQKLFGKKTALLVAPFLLVMPFFMRYSFEIRMYAPAILVSVAATFAMWTAWRNKLKRWWIIYALLVAVGMYLTYMMVLVFVAHAIWLIFVTARSEPSEPFLKHFIKQKWLLAYLGATVLYAAWIPTALKHFSGGALSGIGTMFGWEQLLGFFSFSLLYTPTWQLKLWQIALIAIVVITTTIFLIHNFKKYFSQRENWVLLIFLTIIPIILLFIISNPSFGKPSYIERYLIVFILFFYLLVATTLSNSVANGQKTAIIAYFSTLAILTFGTVNLINVGNFNFQRMERSESKIASTVLVDYCQDQIIVDDFYLYIELFPYMPKDCNYTYYSENPVDFAGGWAPLSILPNRRIGDPTSVTTGKIAFVTVRDKDLSFTKPNYYIETEAISIGSRKILLNRTVKLCDFEREPCYD
ncbi:MAG: glycosyltransferase family 39 protein [Candidatus Nomurabacteria bacterium]|jgi:uncharacterized membrane protein|nr:glycosyltransferase family 39 protein [Candidatus Nomurabacteria bacterium]